jgi:superfamily II DNA or RNA helicase
MNDRAFQLRIYQGDAITDLREAHTDGHRQIIWTGATGSGKTVIFSKIISMVIANKSKIMRAMVLVHRIEILDQTVSALARYNLNPGVICGNNFWTASQVHAAMVQSIGRKLEVMKTLNILPDLVIVDEAHHCTSPTYKKITSFILQHKPESLILGFTATPERTDGVGLNKAGYTKLVEGPQYADLLNPKYTGGEVYLCPPVVFHSPKTLELSRKAGKKNSKGDFDSLVEEAIFGEKVIVNDTIKLYKKYFNGAPVILFCASVGDCHTISDAMKKAGWKGGVVFDKMDKDTRRDLIRGLGDGRYNFLCSFDIISEGTDIPVTAGCIIRRRTTSLILYMQMVGRSARRYPGKKHNIIIDQAGVSLIHGHPLTRRHWELEGKAKRRQVASEIITTTCQNCFALLAGKPRKCRYCGADLTNKGPDGEAEIKIVAAPMSILPAPVECDTEVMAEVEEAADVDAAVYEAIAQGRIARAKLKDIAHKLGKSDKWLTKVWNEANFEETETESTDNCTI